MERPKYVYGIYDHDIGLAKIGYTGNPGGRLPTFGVGIRPEVKTVFCIEVETGIHEAVEKLAHASIANARAVHPQRPKETEWYRVQPEHFRKLGEILKRFMAELSHLDRGRRSSYVHQLAQRTRDEQVRGIRG